MLEPYQIGFVTVVVGGLWFAIRNSSRARRINILLSVLGLVLVYAIAIMSSTVKRSQFIQSRLVNGVLTVASGDSLVDRLVLQAIDDGIDISYPVEVVSANELRKIVGGWMVQDLCLFFTTHLSKTSPVYESCAEHLSSINEAVGTCVIRPGGLSGVYLSRQFIEANRHAPPTVVKLLAHEISHCTFSFDHSSDPNDLMYETAVDVVLPEQSAWTVNHYIQDHVKNGLESSAPQSRFFTRR